MVQKRRDSCSTVELIMCVCIYIMCVVNSYKIRGYNRES